MTKKTTKQVAIMYKNKLLRDKTRENKELVLNDNTSQQQ